MRLLAAILLDVLVCLAQPTPAFRSDVGLVHVDAEVTDGTRVLTGFNKEDFVILDNGVPQTILYFSQDEEPLDLILLFDISGSMRPKVAKVAAGAQTAFSELRPGDRIAVMVFHRDSLLLTPFTEDMTEVQVSILNIVQGKFRGGTRLLAAVDDAAKYFLQQPRTQRRRAVLILTDDFGQRSRRASTVTQHLWEADASLSGLIIRRAGETAIATATVVGNPMLALLREGMGGVAEKTGGDALKVDDPVDAFREMMQRIRRRYSLYYALPHGTPGELRQVKVELSSDALRRAPNGRVRARKGYLIPRNS